MIDEEIVKEKRKVGKLPAVIFTLLGLFLVIAGIIVVLRMVGLSRLKSSADINSVQIQLDSVSVEEKKEDGKEITIDGKKYRFNEDIVSVLVMGIDKETVKTVGGESWEAEGELAGGQADGLFLVVINPHKKAINVIAINRNTMTNVDVYDEEGNFQGTFVKQIALQHGYGDGKELSCERQMKAVSELLGGIPINAYASISMDAIPELNDAVGGIKVEVLDDIVYPEYDMNLHQGETVTLHGDKAYWYVRLRNENVFNSNELRLKRQKQYLSAFASTAKAEAMGDINVAISLYQTVAKYMVTDVDLSEFTYMATEYLGYDFDMNSIHFLEGEVFKGMKFEEFYTDDEALEKLIIDMFYEPE